MTTWVDTPAGGRDRGARAVARAWVEVLLRPRRFFETGIAPADQAPALTFAMAVTAASTVGMAVAVPALPPTVAGSQVAGAVVVVGVLVLLVTPIALHLTAAIGTLALAAFAPDRRGVSETVQLVGYASAPFSLAWVPVAIADVSTSIAVGGAFAYAAGLFAIGIATRHRATPARAIAAAVPAVAFAWGVVTAIRIGSGVVFGG